MQTLEAAPATLPATEPPPLRKHAHILTVARNMIARPYGWGRESFEANENQPPDIRYPRVCILGGLNTALELCGYGGRGDYWWVNDVLRTAIRRAIMTKYQIEEESRVYDLAGWNDNEERSQAEVVAILDDAIGILETSESHTPDWRTEPQLIAA